MTVTLAYVAVSKGPITADFCARFMATYRAYPPGADHRFLVLCNGGELPDRVKLIFSSVNAEFYPRNNDAGWDISAYIEAAHGPCRDVDMLVCLGESVFFHREGWLRRLSESWNKSGPGMYGPFASYLVRPHLNTSAFACPPSALREYPIRVTDRSSRYMFEHGEYSFWKHVQRQRMPAKLVTWDGEYPPREWRKPPNILWRGTQNNCLMYCNHTERWVQAQVRTKVAWSRAADSPFR